MKPIYRMTLEEWKSLSDEQQDKYYTGTPYTPAHTNYHLIMCLDAHKEGKPVLEEVKTYYNQYATLFK